MTEGQFAIAAMVVLVLVCAAPYLLYQTVKMCTFAVYRGRQLFEDWTKEKEQHGRNQK